VKYAALKGLLYLRKPASAADTTKESAELKLLFGDKSEIIAMWSRLCYMLLNGVSEEHLTSITKHMRSPNAEVRGESCKAMAIIGVEAKSQVGELVVCLDDKDPDVALWACAALAQMKEAGKVALPKLLKMSKEHSNPAVRRAAEEAIKRLGEDEKVAK
jgi:HEAT repeat protein